MDLPIVMLIADKHSGSYWSFNAEIPLAGLSVNQEDISIPTISAPLITFDLDYSENFEVGRSSSWNLALSTQAGVYRLTKTSETPYPITLQDDIYSSLNKTMNKILNIFE